MAALLMSGMASAQDFSEILQSIGNNSKQLGSGRKTLAAAHQESRKLDCLGDLEIEYGNLKGTPESGKRHDLSISQSFDFPTVIAIKKKLARYKSESAAYEFWTEQQKVMLMAKQLCIQVVFCNAMMEHLEEDLAETHAMSDAINELYDKGQATIIDRNKAHQAFLMFDAEFREFKTLHAQLLAQLQYMNGGSEVRIDDTSFVHAPIKEPFDDILRGHLSKSGEILSDTAAVMESIYSLKVEKSKYLPQLSVGYMSEKEAVHWQGVTVGMNLPIWGRKKEISKQKLLVEAAEMQLEDTKLRKAMELKNTYDEIIELQETYEALKKHLSECDTDAMLKKMLNNGQITILDYLTERQSIHEMHEKILEVERDLELRKVELEPY